MRRLLYLVIAALYLQGTLGCAFIRNLCGSFHKPEFSFNRVELQDISLTGITINLHFNLTNDNPIGLNIAQLQYAFQVNGHPFISGHPPNGLNIGADSVTDLSFPAHVNFQDLARTIEEFLNQNTATYTASGTIGFNTPLGLVSFPLSHSGSFDVPKIPEIQIQPPTLTNISLSSAHLNLPIAINNRNVFPIPFGGLSTQVFIGNAPALAPAIPQQSALSSHENRVVNLGVDVNFLQAGMAVANAIRNKQADIALRGTVNLGGLNVPVNISQRLNFR